MEQDFKSGENIKTRMKQHQITPET